MKRFKDRPMKALVTGHSRGIGKTIHDWLSSGAFFTDYQVTGRSRSSGNGITTENVRAVVEFHRDYNIFINNSPTHYANLLLMEAFANQWKDREETFIINMGSSAGRAPVSEFSHYSAMKAGMRHQSHILQNRFKWPRVFLMEPGYVYTDMLQNFKGKAMETTDVLAVLQMYFRLYETNPSVYLREATFYHADHKIVMT